MLHYLATPLSYIPVNHSKLLGNKCFSRISDVGFWGALCQLLSVKTGKLYAFLKVVSKVDLSVEFVMVTESLTTMGHQRACIIPYQLSKPFCT